MMPDKNEAIWDAFSGPLTGDMPPVPVTIVDAEEAQDG